MEDYDPSFFIEKEIYINDLRQHLESEEESEWKDICTDLVETYEMLVDLYRNYVDCYDEEEKESAWQSYYKAHTIFNEALEFIEVRLAAC